MSGFGRGELRAHRIRSCDRGGELGARRSTILFQHCQLLLEPGLSLDMLRLGSFQIGCGALGVGLHLSDLGRMRLTR